MHQCPPVQEGDDKKVNWQCSSLLTTCRLTNKQHQGLQGSQGSPGSSMMTVIRSTWVRCIINHSTHCWAGEEGEHLGGDVGCGKAGGAATAE
jgi:hypothetical protein